MTRRIRAVALVGVLLTAGCSPAIEYEPEPEPTRSRVPTASVSAMRADLLAALQRLTGAPYRFTIAGGTPDGGTFTAGGTVDPAGKRYESTIQTVEPTGAQAYHVRRIVVGTDVYLKEPSVLWTHVDMTRVKRDNWWYVDPADPAGLAPFLTGITNTPTVRRTPEGWTLQLHNEKVRDLPFGAPTYRRFAGTNLPFTVKADAQGTITAIETKVDQSSGPDVVFTTTFTAHGAPVKIGVPPKKETREAAAHTYDG